jgi:hypothetical protein
MRKWAWMLLLPLMACGATPAAGAPNRFVVTNSQEIGASTLFRTVQDTKSGTCFVIVGDYRGGVAVAPKEVCE